MNIFFVCRKKKKRKKSYSLIFAISSLSHLQNFHRANLHKFHCLTYQKLPNSTPSTSSCGKPSRGGNGFQNCSICIYLRVSLYMWYIHLPPDHPSIICSFGEGACFTADELYSAVQCSAVQRSVVQCRVVQCSAV